MASQVLYAIAGTCEEAKKRIGVSIASSEILPKRTEEEGMEFENRYVLGSE